MPNASRGLLKVRMSSAYFESHMMFQPRGLAFDHGFVVDQTDHAHIVGDGILVVLVEIEILVFVGDVLVIVELREIKLFEHSLVLEALDHVIRGDDYIVSDSAAFKLGVHRLVIVVIAVIDLDPGEFFEFLVDIEGILGSRRICIRPS